MGSTDLNWQKKELVNLRVGHLRLFSLKNRKKIEKWTEPHRNVGYH